MPFRSGFVSIIGRPNAGKSTLLNALVGEKLAIVTHKPQTTRNRITGIVNVKKVGRRQPGQIVFVDTPGVHKPTDALNKRMMKEVEDALVGCDLLLLMIDVSQKFGSGDEFVLEMVKRTNAKAFLILNKIDLIPKGRLLPMIEQYSKLHSFEAVIPVSAEKKQGLEELVTAVVNALPEGPKYFPLDQVTDQPERFVVAELIREQVLINTKEEVPYATGVIVEKFEDLPKLVKIAAAICVEREGQKGIIIGKQGSMLKHIGTRARLEIERFLGKKVFLELFVKVREGWRGSARAVEETLDWKRQLEGLTSKTTPE
jgi:GTP-binding protein Era